METLTLNEILTVRGFNLKAIKIKSGASSTTAGDLGRWKIRSDRNHYPGIIEDISILSPQLDEIIWTIKSYESVVISHEDLLHAKKLCEDLKVTSEGGDEARLVRIFTQNIQAFLGLVKVKTVMEKNASPAVIYRNHYNLATNNGPDGFIEHQFNEGATTKHAVTTIFECKRVEGEAGDPNVQVIFDYAKVAKKMISDDVGGFTPTLLLTLAGSTLSVGIGVVTYEIMAAFIVEGFKCVSHEETAKLLIAVGKAAKLIKASYDPGMGYAQPCIFPVLPLTVNFPLQSVSLQIIGRIVDKHLYRAKGPRFHVKQKEFAVKFAKSYSVELHHLLEGHELAPKLHCHYELQAEHLICLIMDWVPTALSEKELAKLPAMAKQKIAESLFALLCLLERNGFVHGDLRHPNIIVTHDSSDEKDSYKVSVIDFDFSGKAGVAKYPIDLNYPQFPWLSESDAGCEIRITNDKRAILHYIYNVLELSEVDDGVQQGFVIKFAKSSYSMELHHLLEGHELAPKLFFHDYELRAEPDSFCLIMDWVPTALSEKELAQLPAMAKQKIAESLFALLCLLERNGFVHGDLRHPNIIVAHDSSCEDSYKVSIIGFDFSGKAGVAKYPIDLNYPQFPWLSESDAGCEIRITHDKRAIFHYIDHVLELREVDDGVQQGEAVQHEDQVAETTAASAVEDVLSAGLGEVTIT